MYFRISDEESVSPVPKNDTQEGSKQKQVVQWQVDSAFKKEQERLKIPSDPQEW